MIRPSAVLAIGVRLGHALPAEEAARTWRVGGVCAESDPAGQIRRPRMSWVTSRPLASNASDVGRGPCRGGVAAAVHGGRGRPVVRVVVAGLRSSGRWRRWRRASSAMTSRRSYPSPARRATRLGRRGPGPPRWRARFSVIRCRQGKRRTDFRAPALAPEPDLAVQAAADQDSVVAESQGRRPRIQPAQLGPHRRVRHRPEGGPPRAVHHGQGLAVGSESQVVDLFGGSQDGDQRVGHRVPKLDRAQPGDRQQRCLAD